MAPSWSSSPVAVAGLVAANLVPLAGVLAFGWDLHSILVIYWLENGVVGLESAAKILRASGEDDPDELPSMSFNDRDVASFVGRPRTWIAAFFAVHYGGFWIVHGSFVMVLPLMFPGFAFASPQVVALGLVVLTAYHLISYRLNYVGEREHQGAGPVTLMIDPYRRVLVLHVTIVLGAFAIAALGAPAGALTVMVLAKTLLDLRGHWRVHGRARERTPTSGPAGTDAR